MLIESLESRALFAAGGTGLSATYFNNTNFTGTQVSRLDPRVDFDWGTKSPSSNIASDTYVARWTGQVKPALSEKYTFSITSDDGVQLWVNNQLLISKWDQTGIATNTGSITLNAAKRYDFKLEYREKTGSASVHLNWSSPSTPFSVEPSTRLFPAASVPVDTPLAAKVDHAFTFAVAQLKQTLADLGGSTTKFPSITGSDGKWQTVDYTDWTSGFFAGSLWQVYKHTTEKSLRLSATSLTNGVNAAKSAGDDTGFRFVPTYLNLYNTMQSPVDRQILIDAAASKIATYNDTVGMFRTLNAVASHSGNAAANFPVLMDHTMDLELIYEAAKLNGNTAWITKANNHLAKLETTMVRPDGGTFQYGYYNAASGAFVSGETKQGLSDSSTWARGQGWALYSFVTGYTQTGRADFLATAKKLANYYIAHLPADGVPYWDFNAPVDGSTPRDSSAGAIATSALLKLATLIPGDADAATYKSAAQKTLGSLCSSAYLAEGTSGRGILLHGAKWVAKGQKDNSLIYGDYYFLEAMNRYLGA